MLYRKRQPISFGVKYCSIWGGGDTKENSGDSKIIPLNITISKAAESASTKGFVNAVAMCASLSRHLPGNADKGPLHACQGHWKISTEFNT